MKTDQLTLILEKTIDEIEYIKDVIKSCNTPDQLQYACDWADRWCKAKMTLLIKHGMPEESVKRILNLKNLKVLRYNKN